MKEIYKLLDAYEKMSLTNYMLRMDGFKEEANQCKPQQDGVKSEIVKKVQPLIQRLLDLEILTLYAVIDNEELPECFLSLDGVDLLTPDQQTTH